MASPQKENGHIQISTELWEAWSKIRVCGEAEQVLKVIVRKTYGFKKKEDAIALSQFVLATGLKKSAVCKALNKLRGMNLVTQKGNAIANIYSFNKDYDTWKPLPKKETLPKKEISVTQKGKNRNPKSDIQKIITKDTITKDIVATPKIENRVSEFFESTEDQEKIIQALVVKKLPEATARHELNKFINYWTELNQKGKRRWELEKTFEVKKRLVNWFNNLNKWSSEKASTRKAVKL